MKLQLLFVFALCINLSLGAMEKHVQCEKGFSTEVRWGTINAPHTKRLQGPSVAAHRVSLVQQKEANPPISFDDVMTYSLLSAAIVYVVSHFTF